jgi:hypothetical protein
MMRPLLGFLLAGALAVSACSNSTTSPSTTTTTTTSTTTTSSTAASSITTEYFTGTLSPKTSQFFSFTPAAAGGVAVTLVSTMNAKVGQAIPSRLTLSLGVPSGYDCVATSSVVATPGLNAQLTATLPAGTYCVNLTDSGPLTADALFVVRINHP